MAKSKKRKVIAKRKKLVNKKPAKQGSKHRPVKRRKVLVSKKSKKVRNVKITVKKAVKKIKRKVTQKRIVKKLARKKIAKKAVRRKLPKMKKQAVKPVEGFSAETLFKAKIKVIGVGGGGGSIVSEIGRSLEKATFVIADTDIRALKKKSGIKYFWFGQDLTHGLGTGVNVDLAKSAAEEAKEKISTFFKDQDIVIFVASLGGGLGSGATQVFAEAAREFGGITFGIFTMPFKFEGKNKYRIAQNALKFLRKSLNVSLVIPNEKIFKIIDSSTPITNAFSTVNKSLIGSLESLIDLIYNPGIINIDFADLRTILKGRGNSAFLNTIEESGKDRIEKTCKNIFKNPLLQNSAFKADKILFDIAGSENLSMFEVEKISSHIATLNPKAKIIFGISRNHKLKNKIKTTILMTGVPPGSQNENDEPEPAITKKPLLVAKEKKVKAKNKKLKFHDKKPVSLEIPIAVKEKELVSLVPVSVPEMAASMFEQKLDIVEVVEKKSLPAGRQAMPIGRQAIRRSGLEIRKAEEQEEKKRIAQEKEWEIPAFLRKAKIKS